MTGKRLIARLCGAIPEESRPLVAFMLVAGAAIFLGYCLNASLAQFAAYLVGGGTIILLANRRATAMENNVRVAEKGQVIARFKNAVEMLGSQHSPIWIGAIYALHQMAEEEKELRKSVFDVLCEFARVAESGRETARQIVIDILFSSSEENIYHGFRARLPKANFSGFRLPKLNLANANLSGATFGDMSAAEVDLTDANLTFAKSADKVNLKKAILVGADLSNSTLNNVHFDEANFKRAVMQDADFSGSYFHRARNLTYEQLATVRSLRDVSGLEVEVEAKLRENHLRLFE